MMICNKEYALEYINQLAYALRVVTDYPHDFNLLETSNDFSLIADGIFRKLNCALENGILTLLNQLYNLAREISSENDDQRYTKAFTMAIWLDHHMTYEIESDLHMISMNSIIPISTEQEILLTSLNTNVKETQIIISPCFPVASIYNIDENGNKHEHRRYNRNALSELNGKLINCKYMEYRDDITVSHLVLSINSTIVSSPYYRVAFIPFTSRSDLLQTKPETMEVDGTIQSVVTVTGLTDEKMINHRFKSALDKIIQRDLHIDLLFGCEMLGTNEMYKKDENDFIPFLEEAALEAALQNSKLPDLILLPSRWENRSNFLWVSNSNGIHLGTQNKYFPYRDEKNNCREGLNPPVKYELLVIHVYNKQRIVIMICSDFLEAKNSTVYKVIYEEINPSLVIVPAFSAGQYDFRQEACSVSKYGASVVWGNCCGKTGSHDHIGAAQIAGIPLPIFIQPDTYCKENCSSYNTCLFYYDLPLEADINWRKQPLKEFFTHVCA